MLNKYGDIKKDVEFYSDKYAKAFPYYYSAFNEVSTNSIFKFSDCYSLRTFERFLNWFGLVELDYKHKGYIKEINTVKLTELFDKLFKFKYAKHF